MQGGFTKFFKLFRLNGKIFLITSIAHFYFADALKILNFSKISYLSINQIQQ